MSSHFSVGDFPFDSLRRTPSTQPTETSNFVLQQVDISTNTHTQHHLTNQCIGLCNLQKSLLDVISEIFSSIANNNYLLINCYNSVKSIHFNIFNYYHIIYILEFFCLHKTLYYLLSIHNSNIHYI